MFLSVKKKAINCTCSNVIDVQFRQTVCSAVSCYFAFVLFFLATIVTLFVAGAAPFLTAPTPAPAPSKPFRRLRLRLRLRPKSVGSGGSGSGSASLITTIFICIISGSRGDTYHPQRLYIEDVSSGTPPFLVTKLRDSRSWVDWGSDTLSPYTRHVTSRRRAGLLPVCATY